MSTIHAGAISGNSIAPSIARIGSSEPIIHRTIKNVSRSLDTAVTNVIMAEQNKPIVTPASSSSFDDSRLAPPANNHTAATTSIAPVNALTATDEIPRIAIIQPARIAISAPSDPPLAMPSVYGVANGLRNIIWKAAPQMPNVIPTCSANSDRAKRCWKPMIFARRVKAANSASEMFPSRSRSASGRPESSARSIGKPNSARQASNHENEADSVPMPGLRMSRIATNSAAPTKLAMNRRGTNDPMRVAFKIATPMVGQEEQSSASPERPASSRMSGKRNTQDSNAMASKFHRECRLRPRGPRIAGGHANKTWRRGLRHE